MNYWWTALSLAMLIPAMLKLFAASRLFKFRDEPAGMVTFTIHLLHGLLWTLFGGVAFVGSLIGNIELDLPLLVSIPLCIIFLLDRLSAALESLWIAGVIRADFIRKVEPKKEA